MNRAVVVVGSAGAGKSTLINALSGTNQANVGHSKWEDGTADNLTVRDSTVSDLVYVDTPGLDSDNFSANVVEKVQKEHCSANILIVLVINKQTARVTSYLRKFHSIKNDLVGDVPFIVVWTREGSLSESDTSGLLARYPKALSFEFSDPSASVATLRRDLARTELFFPIKATVAAKAAAQMKATAALVIPKAGKVSSVPMVKKVKLFPLSIPPVLSTVLGFRAGRGKKGNIDKLIQDTIKSKKDGSKQYQELKLLGDAVLKYTVLVTLKVAGETDSLEEKMHQVIDNKPSCAMPLFYDEYIAIHHDKALPGEVNSTDHSKSDVVETLLELARREVDSWAFTFIISELFRLVGNERVMELCA